MKDWLGNEYDVGDLILYAAMSGRSVTMVLGRVLAFRENGSIQVCPLKSSRWQQHRGKSYYIDNRTGKRIDPWKGDQHIVEHTHYAHKDNPEWKIPYNRYHLLRWGSSRQTENLGYTLSGGGQYDLSQYELVYVKFKAYVEHKTDPTQKVTIQVTENIVKWTGELPEEKEEG